MATIEEARAELYGFLGSDTEISVVGQNPDFEAALDAFEKAVKAEMPCYRTMTDAQARSCNDRLAPLWPICPSCEARR